MHIVVLNGAQWDTGHVHCGIARQVYCILNPLWSVIIFPCPNINGGLPAVKQDVVKVGAWMSNCIP